MNNLEQLHRDCEILKERNRTKETIEREKVNELNRYCRDIESMIKAGYGVQKACRIIKNRYKTRWEK